MWIRKIILYLWHIKMRERIARTPRMFATEYTGVTRDEARVMARYGIRSPSGLRVAMRKYKVNTLDELVAILEHHRPKRRIRDKIHSMLIRATGGLPYHPYQKQISKIGKKTGKNLELELRRKRVKDAFTT